MSGWSQEKIQASLLNRPAQPVPRRRGEHLAALRAAEAADLEVLAATAESVSRGAAVQVAELELELDRRRDVHASIIEPAIAELIKALPEELAYHRRRFY